MRSHTEVATRMFQALRDAGINLLVINTSAMQVNVIVDGPNGAAALKGLQQTFADTQK
jgi:aspartate kinase